MTNFKQLIEAANFQITGGSEYTWNSYGPHARWLDFNSSVFNVEFSLIFDCDNQTVYQASLYLNDSAFRWINPDFVEKFKAESFAREVDPRIAYENTFYTDCEVFSDFVSKVKESFTTGNCDTSILIALEFTPEQEELFSKLPEGTDLQDFILKALEEKMEFLTKQNRDNWDIVFSTLSQSGVQTSIDNDASPIAEGNIQEIYNWVNSLNLPVVSLSYSDKETAQGIVSTLTANKEQTPYLNFQYIYKK